LPITAVKYNPYYILVNPATIADKPAYRRLFTGDKPVIH